MSKARELAELGAVYDSGALSNRNLIINGAMQVWQRATSTTSTTLTYLIMDRFWTYNVNGTAQRSTDVPSGEGFVYSLHFDGSSTNPVSAFGQPIELPATGKTMLKASTDYTISFWVKGDVSGSINIYHRYRDSKGSANGNVNIDGGSSTVNVTTSWNRVTATFNTGTTVPSTSNNILDIEFSGFTEFTDLYFTGFQLEVGPEATPFEHRSYGDELQRCFRYFRKSAAGTPTQNSFTGSQIAVMSGGDPQITEYLNPPMRTGPTVTLYSSHGSGTSGQWYGAAFGSSFSANARAFNVDAYKFTMDNTDVGASATGWCEIGWTADAEL